MLRYTTDRARPGLVTFYDIRPGNRADLFLQPRNLHRVKDIKSSGLILQDLRLGINRNRLTQSH